MLINLSNMKKIFPALFFALLYTAVAQSASLYILYDPACMDRLEYVSINGNDKSEYIVYHVNTSPGVKVVLEVGPESTTSQDFPPAQVIKCNNAVFDEKLVNAINSNIEKVFMVVKKGNNRYFISPITIAARYLRANDFILYDSPKYRFQFDTQMGTIGENIAYKNPKTQVYFEGMLDNDCSGTLLFQQKAEFAGNPHSNIELIPEVGIVEERSGINAEDAMKNIIRLEKVNGKKLSAYLRKLCKGIEEPQEPGQVANAAPVPDEFLAVGPRVETAKGGTAPAATLNGPAASTATTEFHVVKKGETLYRLSKQYNVSVDQIRAWNNKGSSNTILVGEKLRVAPAAQSRSAAPAAPAEPAAPKEGQIRTLGGPLAYENTTATPPAAAALSSKGVASQYHIVRPGETAASIALRYGYTEQRFREFNNLGANEMPKIGQALKTSDCDCPQTSSSTITQMGPAIPAPGYNPNAYASTQPRVGSPYNDLGLPAQQPTTSGSLIQRTAQPAGSTESFDEDDLNRTSNYSTQEYDYRNTPLFLDRPGAPATTTTTTATYYQPPSPATTTPGRTYSPQGDSYTITGNRIDSGGGAGSTASKGAISSSFSSRSPAAGGAVQEYGAITSRISDNATSSSNGSRRTVYVVKEGDNLYRIARMYGMTVERLRSINNLGAGEVIIPYQKIYLD